MQRRSYKAAVLQQHLPGVADENDSHPWEATGEDKLNKDFIDRCREWDFWSLEKMRQLAGGRGCTFPQWLKCRANTRPFRHSAVWVRKPRWVRKKQWREKQRAATGQAADPTGATESGSGCRTSTIEVLCTSVLLCRLCLCCRLCLYCGSHRP